MVKQTARLIPLLLVIVFAFTLAPALAQSPPAAPLTNDEGGPVRLTGGGRYTNVFEIDQIVEPVVVLLDQGGLYAYRNPAFVARPEGQVFGRFTSNFSPDSFAFQIDLPAEPKGQGYDVDQDGGNDPGVQIWTIAIRNNPLAEPFEPSLLPLEQVNTPWLTSVLTRKPATPDEAPEPYSGTLLIYAPEAGQGFPAGLGDDGLLFTTDDPIVTVPPGYTVVNMDQTPFTFDRSREVNVFIPEDPNGATVSFADLNYKDAFNAFIDFMKERYAYTELHQIDWESWRSEYLPRVEQAQASGDALTYSKVYEEIATRTGDRHTSLPVPVTNTESLLASLELGVGLDSDIQVRNGALFVKPGVVELADGRVLVVNVTPDSSAAKAGIQPLAEIITVNNTPVGQQLESLAAESPAATPEARRLEALQQLFLLPPESSLTVTYRNPGKGENTVTLGTGPVALEDLASLSDNLVDTLGSLPPLATTARQTPGGQTAGYLSWPDFLNDQIKLPLLSEYFAGLQAGYPPGLIIDLRYNGGGSEWLMTYIFSYFFSPDFPARLDLLASSSFDVARNEFVTYPALGIPPQLPISAPSPETYYGGKVIILVSENCASACEFFAAWMKMYGRATIIGPHATAGAGGQVQQIQLPEGLVFNYTYSRQTDRQGNAYIEGIGVEPDVRVPLTQDYAAALANGQDPVLDFALARMDQLLAGESLSGGSMAAATGSGSACAMAQAVTVTGQPPGREMYRPFDDAAINRTELLSQAIDLSGPPSSAAAWRNSVLSLLGNCADDAFVPKQVTVYNPAPDQTTVVVFTEILDDDSLAGEEVRVDLKAAAEEQWQIDWAGVRFKCARGNTADLTKEFCP